MVEFATKVTEILGKLELASQHLVDERKKIGAADKQRMFELRTQRLADVVDRLVSSRRSASR